MKRPPAPRRDTRARSSGAGPAPGLEPVTLGLLLLVPILFSRVTSEVFEVPKAALLATGAAVLAAIALAREFARVGALGFAPWAASIGPRLAALVRRDPLAGAVLLFLLSAAVSTLASPRPMASLLGAPLSQAGLKTAAATAAMYFACRSAAADSRWFARAARAASITGLVASLYALLQLAGLDPFTWTRRAVLGTYWRVPGTLGHANLLGAYLAMTAPLSFWLSRRAESAAARAGWILVALLALLVTATTLSRGAWVSLGVAAVTYAALAIPRARRGAAGSTGARAAARSAPRSAPLRSRAPALALGLLIALGVFLLPLFTPFRPLLLQRIRQITDVRAPSTQSRVYLWRAGIGMAKDHPALGVGTDGYGAAFPRYRAPEYWRVEWNGTSVKAHCEPIQIAATQGIPGLLAGLLVVLLAARAVVRAARKDEAGAAAGAALAAFAVSGLVGFTVVSTGGLAAALAGWAAAAGRDAEPALPHREGTPARQGEETPRPSRAAWAAAAVPVAALWTLLVLIPLRADLAFARALELEPGSAGREAALTRASDLAPWDAGAGSELLRTRLAAAFAVTESACVWDAFDRARSAGERLLRAAPDDAEARALLARALAAQASLRPGAVPPEEVRRAYAQALAIDSTSANVLELAAQGYQQARLFAEAHRAAGRAALLYPEFARPMADLGVMALAEGRFADAADTLRLALGRNWQGEPRAEASARANLASAWWALGRKESAVEEAEKALRLDPGVGPARRILEEAGASP